MQPIIDRNNRQPITRTSLKIILFPSADISICNPVCCHTQKEHAWEVLLKLEFKHRLYSNNVCFSDFFTYFNMTKS